MRLYVVRHGQTAQNVRRVIMGPTGVLSKEGIKQAHQLAERFKTISIDQIFCSTYARAQQTAGIINAVTRAPQTNSALIAERKPATSLIGHAPGSPELEQYMAQSRAHQADPSWHFEDAENMHDIFARAVKFLDLVKQQTHQSILAITHGGFLRYILAAVLYRRDVKALVANGIFKTSIHANTGITLLQLSPQGEWELVTWNDHAHLGDTHNETRPLLPV